MKPMTWKHPGQTRSGVALVAVLVCLVLISTLLLGVVKTSVNHRRQLRNEHQLEQTRWLLDAGISKAISLVAKGESPELTIEVGDGRGRQTRKVELRPVESEGQSGVKVTATISGPTELHPVTSRSKIYYYTMNEK